MPCRCMHGLACVHEVINTTVCLHCRNTIGQWAKLVHGKQHSRQQPIDPKDTDGGGMPVMSDLPFSQQVLSVHINPFTHANMF